MCPPKVKFLSYNAVEYFEIVYGQENQLCKSSRQSAHK